MTIEEQAEGERRVVVGTDEPSERRAAYAEAAPDGVLALDADGFIRYANAAARSMLGVSLGPVVGEQFGVPAGSSPIELSLRTESGRSRPVEMRTTRVTLHGEDRWVVTLREVSRRLRAPAPGGDDPGHLGHLDTALAVTTHELRSPLAVLAASVGALLDDWEDLADDERRRRLRRIEGRITRVAFTVDSILDAVRIAAGTFRPAHHRVVLLDLVLERLPELGAGADGIEIMIPVDLEVDAHPDHLWMVVSNFMSNALAYGSPPRSLWAARSGDLVHIEVRDRGPGVAAEDVDGIFERYARGGGLDDVAGTGLGLWVARSVAEAYGGSVGHRDGDPDGAVFYLELPAPPAAPVRGGSRRVPLT